MHYFARSIFLNVGMRKIDYVPPKDQRMRQAPKVVSLFPLCLPRLVHHPSSSGNHTLFPLWTSSPTFQGATAISQLCSTTFVLLESPDAGDGSQSSPFLWPSN